MTPTVSRFTALRSFILSILSVDANAEGVLVTLQEAFSNDFLVGVALSPSVFDREAKPKPAFHAVIITGGKPREHQR